jgi:glycosyltransferase involved in cell wall biosynthesis
LLGGARASIVVHVKISIITPSFNQSRYLGQTLESLLGQRGEFELEVLVFDGGSTDGSVELLRSIDDPRVLAVSEPDEGQSHAIVKGMARAGGEVVAWLNSDDLYTPGTLAAVAAAFEANPGAQWLVGRCQNIDETGRVIRESITRYKDRQLRRYSYGRLLRENFISQMSVFWRTDFDRQVGGPDLNLHYAMDYDLWLRMAQRCDPLILDRVLGQFRIHGQSKTSSDFAAAFREHYQVARRHARGDRWNLTLNRINSAKIVAAYRVMRMLGR